MREYDPYAYDVHEDLFLFIMIVAGNETTRKFLGMQAHVRDHAIDTTGIVKVHSINVRGFATLPIEFPRGGMPA